MSLDVYLHESVKCPHCAGSMPPEWGLKLFTANVTHNLGRMASQIPMLYEALWRGQWMSDPEALRVAEDADDQQRWADGNAIRSQIGPTEARILIPHLRAGLDELRARPEHYKTFNAENGWGLYEDFVTWIERYLEACERHPNAVVRVRR